MQPLFSPVSPFKYLPASVALAPVYNILNSFALLNRAGLLPHTRAQRSARPEGYGAHLHEWTIRIDAALAPERRHGNRLVFEGLRDALAPDQDWPDFPSYLDNLARQNPFTLRDRVLRRMGRPAPGVAPPDPASLLADPQVYVAHIRRLYPGEAGDPALLAQAHALLGDPPRMHDLIVAHLDHMWETTLAAEWQYVLRRLEHQLSVFEPRLDPQAPAAETFRAFTGRDLPAHIWPQAAGVERIVLVPSLHTGQYVATWRAGATLYVFFGAPPNYTVLLRTSPVGLAELRERLAPLADETRLRILELLAQHGELHAQELIAHLDLSQSSVSRHLKHLIATGYLFERRGDGANKIYSLNLINFDTTIRALQRLLAGETAAAEEPLAEESDTHPRELRRFLDARGRVAGWPAKHKDQLLVLEYLASQFEIGRSYTEKEVNAILTDHSTLDDHASLRRALYDHHFLDRERDGSRYWRAEPQPTQAE